MMTYYQRVLDIINWTHRKMCSYLLSKRNTMTRISGGKMQQSKQQRFNAKYNELREKKDRFITFLKEYIEEEAFQSIEAEDMICMEESFVQGMYQSTEADIIYKRRWIDHEGIERWVYFYVLYIFQPVEVESIPLRLRSNLLALMNHEALLDDKQMQYTFPITVPIIITSDHHLFLYVC